MRTEGIDVWNVDLTGNVDFRISKSSLSKVRNILSRCKILGNVEAIVRRAERHMQHTISKTYKDSFRQKQNKHRERNKRSPEETTNITHGEEWFEQYVSCCLFFQK